MSSPHTENTRSTNASEAGAAIKSSANGARRGYLISALTQKLSESTPVNLLASMVYEASSSSIEHCIIVVDSVASHHTMNQTVNLTLLQQCTRTQNTTAQEGMFTQREMANGEVDSSSNENLST